MKELMRLRLGLNSPLLEVKWTPLVLCTGALPDSSRPEGFDSAVQKLTAHVLPRYHQRITMLVCDCSLASQRL